jgi:NADPH-dependent F420 reductase
MSDRDDVVAVLGGTGPLGRGLARWIASAGWRVVVGSRTASRAVEAAEALAGETGGALSGADNRQAAEEGDIVIVAVPWDGHRELLAELADVLAGRLVVDCVNPVGFDDKGPYPLEVEEGSAAQQAQALLPDSVVVGAFHHVSAVLLNDPQVTTIDTDVLVVGDDRQATDRVRELVDAIPGMRGIFAGRLRNAGQVEALTCNLIAINRRYKAHSGIRVTDV